MKFQIWLGVAGCLLVHFSVLAQPIPGPGAAASPAASQTTGEDWSNVDALRPGTRIIATLKSGEEHIGYLRGATSEAVTIDAGEPRVRQALAKPLIATVRTYDPVGDGTAWGALAGAAGMFALAQAGINSCGKGCEYDGGAAVPLLLGAIGAGAGSLVGWLADRAKGPEQLFPPPAATVQSRTETPNRFFPEQTTVRLGPVYRQMGFRSPHLENSLPAPGIALAVQVSPHISAQLEYAVPVGRYRPKPGSIPNSILENLVPESSRAAGLSYGIESRRVSYVLSQLVGVHPPPWGRLRVTFLGGLGVQGQENRDYYDAYRTLGAGTMTDPMRTERIPGKYYVLDFHSPDFGFVFGFDADFAVIHGLTVTPTLRYNRMGDPGPSLAYGLGAHWRF